MKTYREKIVEVQAVQWKGQNSGEIAELCGYKDVWILLGEQGLMVRSIDGNVKVKVGQWIVKCNKGHKEFYLYIYTEAKFWEKYERNIKEGDARIKT